MNAIVCAIVIHAWEEPQNTAIAIQGIFVKEWPHAQNVPQKHGAAGAQATYDENEWLGDTGHLCKMKTCTAS